MIFYIIVIVFGLLIGNFATSVLYRLPRGIGLCGIADKKDRPPFCSYCLHKLKFYEYLPVLSWISTLGKCNYCKHSIAIEYFILEIGAAIISCACLYLFHEINDLYILIFCFTLACLLNVLIYRMSEFTSNALFITILFLGIIYRTLIDGTIMYWLSTISIACIVVLLLTRFAYANLNSDRLHILLLSSIWCPASVLPIYGSIMILFYILKKRNHKFDIYSAGFFLLVLIVWSRYV